MAESLTAQVLRINNTDFLNCTKIAHIPCGSLSVLGTGWFYPVKNSGGGIYYKTTMATAKPNPTAVKFVRVRDEKNLGRNYFVAIADGDTERVVAENCNLCCGDVPALPTIVIPTPIVEEPACAVTPASAPTAFRRVAYAEPLAAGEKYYPIASKNGVLLTPAPAAAGYTTVGTARTFVNGNYSGAGTWTVDGESIVWEDVTAFQGAFELLALTQLAVNAGTDQNLANGTTTATLTGTAAGHNKVTWAKVSGPGSPVITSPHSLTTGITGLATGTTVFSLTATNAAGATLSDNVSIIVAA